MPFCRHLARKVWRLLHDAAVGSRIICPLCESDDLRTSRLSEHVLMCVCKRCDVLFTINLEPPSEGPVPDEPEP